VCFIWALFVFHLCAGIYFDVPEITPNAVGIFRFNSNNDMVNIKFHTVVCIELLSLHKLKWSDILIKICSTKQSQGEKS